MPDPKQFKTHKEYLLWYKNYRERNAEKLREYNRRYNKEWRRSFGYHNERNSKTKYPKKNKARRLLQYAVKIGVIKRQKCETCGKENAQAHHFDYNQPLRVNWFCPLCHTDIHKSR